MGVVNLEFHIVRQQMGQIPSQIKTGDDASDYAQCYDKKVFHLDFISYSF